MFVFFFEIPLWIPIYKWIQKKYEILFDESLFFIIQTYNKEEKEKLKKEYIKKIFEISNGINLCIYILAFTICMGFSIYFYATKKILLPPKLGNWKLSILTFFVALMWLISCKCFIIFRSALIEFYKMALHDIDINYYPEGRVYLNKIKKYCNNSVLIITLILVSVFVAIFDAPLIQSDAVRVFVNTICIIIALCPTIILIGSFYFINKIRESMINITLKNYYSKMDIFHQISLYQQLSTKKEKNINMANFLTVFSSIVECITILVKSGFIIRENSNIVLFINQLGHAISHYINITK